MVPPREVEVVWIGEVRGGEGDVIYHRGRRDIGYEWDVDCIVAW